MRPAGRHCSLVCALVFAGWPQAHAEEPRESKTMLDKIELTIEIGRHERFVKTRRSMSAAALVPFATDGCSGGMSSAWRSAASAFPKLAGRHGEHPPWESCCVAHDRIYHTGGPPDGDANASFEARRLADEELRQCVRKVGEDRVQVLAAEYNLGRDQVTRIYRALSTLMHRAVRLGGIPCTRRPWRWGFGWPVCN